MSANDGNDVPPARAAFAHTFQSFAGPLVQPTPPQSAFAPISPDRLPGPPQFAHLFQFFGAPLVPAPTAAVAMRPTFPSVLPGPPLFAHALQSFALPANPVGSFPGFAAAGAATFALSLEPGAKVTYTFGTDIFTSYSGKEQRCNTTGPRPRQRFEGSAFLLDSSSRDTRGALQRAASAGSTFLLALPYEELELSADSVGTTLTVSTTAYSDWAIVTQRVLVWGVDNTTISAVIQAVTSTTIRLDVAPGTTGRAGARIMPLIQVLLDSAQGFSRYPVNVDLWSIRCMANVFGWVGQDVMGKGVQITTYAAGAPVDQSTITEDDVLIFDRPNLIDGTASESMLSLAEVVDLGALPFSIGGAPSPHWAWSIKYASRSEIEWQWFKAFLRQTWGRQKSFLLPTNRPDLVFVSASGSTLKVQSATVSGSGDYTAWYTSQAHRRLALTKIDGSIQYVTTLGWTDNHDGTLSLILDASITGTVTKVSLLEQVRFDNSNSDDFAVTWDGATFSVDLIARTTEEALSSPGYPTTAAAMRTACGGLGTWSGGWLCEDRASPLAAAFGGNNLPESNPSGGSPAYHVPGPLGDRAVRISVSQTGFACASTSFLDADNTEDICGAMVMRSILPVGVSGTTLLSKNDFVSGPGYELGMRNDNTLVFTADHSTPGNVIVTVGVPDSIIASNEWFAVMWAMDRGAGTMRIAAQSLISGASALGTPASIATVGSLTNAQPLRIHGAGALGATFEVAALYMGVGVGVASGLPAGLATALGRFAAYLGA